MGARYYNPVEGRFTQVDPSGQDFYYNFTGDNPINYSDPSGYGFLDYADKALEECDKAAAETLGVAVLSSALGGPEIGVGEVATACLLGGAAGVFEEHGDDANGNTLETEEQALLILNFF